MQLCKRCRVASKGIFIYLLFSSACRLTGAPLQPHPTGAVSSLLATAKIAFSKYSAFGLPAPCHTDHKCLDTSNTSRMLEHVIHEQLCSISSTVCTLHQPAPLAV